MRELNLNRNSFAPGLRTASRTPARHSAPKSPTESFVPSDKEGFNWKRGTLLAVASLGVGMGLAGCDQAPAPEPTQSQVSEDCYQGDGKPGLLCDAQGQPIRVSTTTASVALSDSGFLVAVGDLGTYVGNQQVMKADGTPLMVGNPGTRPIVMASGADSAIVAGDKGTYRIEQGPDGSPTATAVTDKYGDMIYLTHTNDSNRVSDDAPGATLQGMGGDIGTVTNAQGERVQVAAVAGGRAMALVRLNADGTTDVTTLDTFNVGVGRRGIGVEVDGNHVIMAGNHGIGELKFDVDRIGDPDYRPEIENFDTCGGVDLDVNSPGNRAGVAMEDGITLIVGDQWQLFGNLTHQGYKPHRGAMRNYEERCRRTGDSPVNMSEYLDANHRKTSYAVRVEERLQVRSEFNRNGIDWYDYLNDDTGATPIMRISHGTTDADLETDTQGRGVWGLYGGRSGFGDKSELYLTQVTDGNWLTAWSVGDAGTTSLVENLGEEGISLDCNNSLNCAIAGETVAVTAMEELPVEGGNPLKTTNPD